MTLLHRLFWVGFAAALLAPYCQGQTPSETARCTENSSPGGWLGTEDPKTIAWRAHEAMVTQDTTAVPELLSLASRWQPLVPQPSSENPDWRGLTEEQQDERDAMLAVLDALIQLEASVPATTLHSLAPDFENAVAVILARMPVEESRSLSLEFYRSPVKKDSTLQYVSAALLARHPPEGFGAHLLGDIKVSARVTATVPGSPWVVFGICGGSCGEAVEPEREDWPQIGQYKLWTEISEGASILVPGTEPIYVSREESTHSLANGCGAWRGLYFGAEQRRALIAEMLGVSAEDIPWETYLQKHIEFRSLAQFTGELLAFVEEQQAMYRETAKALHARGLLAASEASQTLPLMELNLTDARRIGSRDENSDQEDSNDQREDIEPISREVIGLPARIVWEE